MRRVAGHLTIGEGAICEGQTGVTKDVPPKAVVVGMPARPRMDFNRQIVNMSKLPELKKKIQQLEERIRQLEEDREAKS